ncbi:GDSL esterase/lipase 7 [Vitis vinifera]|uniref:GDSL esterase/lipase 7 n=1 Tax=Vitis vinifera TaxID=29760 RepID=A0A438JC68_VITVI|nr:GDSL esterase/lipase 7 [Vitis vinifera]
MAMMNSSSALTLFCCFTIFLQFLSVNSRDSPPLAPALYVFGDSLFDCGNNNLLPTLAKANYLPYGMNFPKGVTGRFTDGRTVPDFIAEYLRLPYSPPSISVRTSVPLTGLNYASGVCGILPETGSLFGKCLNLDDQIELFRLTVELKLVTSFGSKKELSEYLSKSIFIFSIGNNDYINNYLLPLLYDSSKRYTPQQFAQLLVGRLSQGLKNLYILGARKMIVFELGPIGCMPWITRRSKKGQGKCDEEANSLVSHFNNDLGSMLKGLTSTLSGSTFVLGHVNWLGYDAIKNPSNYGLRDTSTSCCNSWLNGTATCIPFGKPCANTNEHFFWDGFHLTEAVSSLVANACINGSSVCLPMNMEGLLKI